jgi:hypothetical protein
MEQVRSAVAGSAEIAGGTVKLQIAFAGSGPRGLRLVLELIPPSW